MLEIFQYDFMIRALFSGGSVALISPLIGIFLIVRRYSLITDTLAHISLLGVVLGLVLLVYPIFSAIFISILAVWGMEVIRKKANLSGDAILALFLYGSLALAVVILSLSSGFNVNFFSFLFGSIATVSILDVYTIFLLSVLVVFLIFIFFKEFVSVSFNEELALSQGINVGLINSILLFLTALVIPLSVRIVGALLVGALTVIPVLSAMQWKLSFKNTIFLSILFSEISVFLGLIFAFYLDLSSGGAIALTSVLIFIFSLVLGKIR